MGDEKPDFVDVPFDDDDGRAVIAQAGVGVAQHVMRKPSSAKLSAFRSPHFRWGGLIPRGARRIDQTAKKIVCALFQRCSFLNRAQDVRPGIGSNLVRFFGLSIIRGDVE